jgi:putative transposase
VKGLEARRCVSDAHEKPFYCLGVWERELLAPGIAARRESPPEELAEYAARRQAAAVVWREVYTGFTVPTGVWWVRENVRAMFRERPARFDTLEGALGAAGRVLKVPLERWLSEFAGRPIVQSARHRPGRGATSRAPRRRPRRNFRPTAVAPAYCTRLYPGASPRAMRAYRALLLRHGIMRLPPGMQQKVAAPLRVQEELRRWATEWAKSNGRMPLPEGNPLRYLAHKFVHAWRALDWLRARAIKRGTRPPLILNAQLRLNNERDVSMGVLVDAARREVRIRKLGIGMLALPLSDSAIRWILKRVGEGARLVLAMVWVEGGRLCVALIFRRDVMPMQPRRVLAVDLNALHNGIAYAVVERGRILERSVLRPDVCRLARLQREAARLDSLCARKGGAYCDMAGAAKSRLWRLLREWEEKVARLAIKLALQYRAAIVIDVPESDSMRELRQSGGYPAEKKALLNFGRLRGLAGVAEWHGVPCIEARLFSTICPLCGAKMAELPERRVKCARCGLTARRDEVPAMWAARRFDELIRLAKLHPSFSAQFRMLIYSAALPLP